MKLELKYDYKAFPLEVEKLGLNTILEAEATAANTEVENCPFCGAAPWLLIRTLYGKPTATITCRNCACGTAYYPACRDGFTFKILSISDCINRAAKAWNRRPTKGATA